MRRLGVRVPHGAPMKIVLRQKSYFYCRHIKSVGTRTRKGRCIRENVQWTFEQQRLQTCVACAGGRMHSIRKSPSWRANENSSSAEELFLLQEYQISRDSNPTFGFASLLRLRLRCPFCLADRMLLSGQKGARAAASERMSNGHSNSSVSKHA